ncbi:MAG: hypothetical protein DI538_00250 [Azospira oryzae]|nr:MAG: hypothetical protein DI538_00250 [Azospira oryzae]
MCVVLRNDSRKNRMILGLGIVTGAVMGYLYWYFVGCASGSCAITSSPVNSTCYGGVMGWLLVTTLSSSKMKNSNP